MWALFISLRTPILLPAADPGLMELGSMYLLGAGVTAATSLSSRSPIFGPCATSAGREYAAGPARCCEYVYEKCT